MTPLNVLELVRRWWADQKFSIEVVTDVSVDGAGLGQATGINDDDVPLEAVRHYAFYSRPPSGSVGVRLNYGGISLLFCYRSPADEPELEEGEAAIGVAAGALQKFDKNGGVSIDSAVGQKVKMQGGGRGIARLNDTVGAGTTMAAWVADVSTKLNTAGPVVGAPGSVTPPVDFGVVTSASMKIEGDS